MTTKLTLIAIAAALFVAGPLSAGVILTNNLTETNQSFDLITTTHWEGISFLTDNNEYLLDTATLLVEETGVGTLNTAEVDLYSDSSGPNTLLAALTGATLFPIVLTQESFTASGVILLPNTTYWVVLKALSGTLGWGFPNDDIGSGVGFTDTYVTTANSGSTWFIHGPGNHPDQAEVTGDLVPEPSTLWLVAPGCLLLASSRFIASAYAKRRR